MALLIKLTKKNGDEFYLVESVKETPREIAARADDRIISMSTT